LAAAALALTVLLWAAAPLRGAQVIVAFGDSITQAKSGSVKFDAKNKGGYPGRLQKILRKAKAGFDDVEVRNFGRGSETTALGLSRLNFVLDQVAGDDVAAVILMEGTNDVNKVITAGLSLDSVVANLEGMARKVKQRGWFPLYATIIPRKQGARHDSRNIVTFALVNKIRDKTSSGQRVIAEPWEVFFWTPERDKRIYYRGADTIGHPNAAGFDLLAETFGDKLLEIDSLGPVFSKATVDGELLGFSSQLRAKDKLVVRLHESGAGINTDRTYLTLHRRPVESTVTGNKRRVDLKYTVAKAELGCSGQIGIHAEDLAEPPNVRDLVLRAAAPLDVAGKNPPQGDVNGDCRVSGFDLVLLGHAFGSIAGDENFDPQADFDENGKINGKDLAQLAAKFGTDKS
jgi:lysophospholipase L1-like esterase